MRITTVLRVLLALQSVRVLGLEFDEEGRAYGFHSAPALIAMLFLCCSGISVSPAHIRAGSTH